MKKSLTAAEVDALIDTLDHTERTESQIWRKPLSELQERLGKAQRIRRWIGAPILGLALLAPGMAGASEWLTWLGYSLVIGAIALMVMQLVLERVLPVLDRESRIQALGNYFLPWRDEDEEHEFQHDAA